MSAGRVVGIFAHPDDESILAGGTLAACAAAGLEVVIVCLTRGEAGPIAHPDLATRQTLGAVREAELRAAADALGVQAVECLGYPDGGLPWVEAGKVEADLARRLRHWRPEAVMTFGPEGLYGHPDHVAVYRRTMAVVDALAGKPDDRNGPWRPWVYQATWPQGRMAELVSAVAARGLPAHLWGLHPDDFGAPPSLITTVLDVRRFVGPKLRALRSHRTQLAPEHLFGVVPEDLAAEFLGREYFVRVRPLATPGDWLAEAVGGAAATGARGRP